MAEALFLAACLDDLAVGVAQCDPDGAAFGCSLPQLLRHFHAVTEPAPALVPSADAAPTPVPVTAPAPARATPATAPAVAEPLLSAARLIAETHLAEHGEPIAPGQLKNRLGVALPLATAVHAQLSA